MHASAPAATTLTLLIIWTVVDGSPRYESMAPYQRIAFISDIGAQRLKPLFVAGCVITAVFLSASFMSERWLRHSGHLARNRGKRDKAFAIIAILLSLIGGAALILLSIFDTLRHARIHQILLMTFIGSYVLSTIFVCAEYYRLGIHYREHKIIFVSFWIKLAFIVVEMALSIALVVLRRRMNDDQAAILEWIIAYIFTFYILSYAVDLLPAVRTRHHIPQGKRITEMSQALNGAQRTTAISHISTPTLTPSQTNAYSEQPTLATDSVGDQANIEKPAHNQSSDAIQQPPEDHLHAPEESLDV
ncbi:conserved hypothetical protein [Histoplasma capsulatum G186AR]|uniref:CWH43-like N-terminal domain-containing protein n=1 Tax=Ajellomyces capsulatus (strain G186AR / H82 / ATCC MYA-2454 / RMSCC 2432) TaxID=447093 RepID=C0NA82_AJECG|nr:uncharacterized protein HCBG_00028 [Histoplasma capsulatum G186AR]EEH10573.1 conserved hypothetical protein [Histoplasma capsulatum G186AR]